jgi:hypothetical protein
MKCFQVKLQPLDDDGQLRNGWLICTRGKSFAVYAATATEKQVRKSFFLSS